MNIIFDLDGTLADCGHRLHFICGKTQDHRAFFKACVDDKPIIDMIKIVLSLQYLGANIFIVSGRSNEVHKETTDWILKNVTHTFGLYMREAGDHRPDWIVKKEIYMEHFYNKIKVDYVFDDRDQVVAMWRSLGLRCLQVAPGNF